MSSKRATPISRVKSHPSGPSEQVLMPHMAFSDLGTFNYFLLYCKGVGTIPILYNTQHMYVLHITYICTHTYVHTYVHTYMYTHICTHTYVHTHMYTHICTYTYVPHISPTRTSHTTHTHHTHHKWPCLSASLVKSTPGLTGALFGISLVHSLALSCTSGGRRSRTYLMGVVT